MSDNNIMYTCTYFSLFTFLIVSPISAGDSAICTPADLRLSIFSVAPPLPCDMIAPA